MQFIVTQLTIRCPNQNKTGEYIIRKHAFKLYILSALFVGSIVTVLRKLLPCLWAFRYLHEMGKERLCRVGAGDDTDRGGENICRKYGINEALRNAYQ